MQPSMSDKIGRGYDRDKLYAVLTEYVPPYTVCDECGEQGSDCACRDEQPSESLHTTYSLN